MSRADRVAGRLSEVDALLITDPANLRYVTGFTGSNGFAVVGRDVRRFVTDFRYVEQAKVEVPDFDREQGPQELYAALTGLEGVGRLGFDDAHLSVKAHRRLGELIPEVELVAASGVVEEVRAVKEPGEILRIGAAAALVDEIYGWLLELGIVGRTERDVAIALEHEMRLRGASGPSFDSIVASAEHGALPHATPRDVAIAPDTLVTIDIGAVLDGYCSDCTRTWATGPNVSDELREIYALTLRAQVTALDAVRPGPLGREVDAVARDIIDAAGHAEHFGHGLGHGVGIVTHEGPRLARSGTTALEAGNVVTVEPGVYVPGVGGVRIEDLVVVTEGGRDVLSKTTKELLTVE
ncbi:M24 family metallopeptidase [Solirubrobacter soli]|uniref:M24 family metallopeptidase n=1 Tax=Solirubrobacter soli TaxID=363832 RepID=UPI0004223765|nr:Xaa-Pro peptidase family protein [Solirubrobacter soli]